MQQPFILKLKINHTSVSNNRVDKLLDLKVFGVYLVSVKSLLVLKNRIQSKVVAVRVKVKTDLCAVKTVYLSDKGSKAFFHFFHITLFIIVISDIPKNNMLNHSCLQNE